jgi:hypothetical protein
MVRRVSLMGLGVFGMSDAEVAAKAAAKYNMEAMPRPYVLGEGIKVKDLLLRMHFSHESYKPVDMTHVVKAVGHHHKQGSGTDEFFELRRMLPPGKTRCVIYVTRCIYM